MTPRTIQEICADIGDKRYADAAEPRQGPYEIETPLMNGGPDWANSAVVRLPREGEPPDGFVTVFVGAFAECNAFISAMLDVTPAQLQESGG